MTLNGGVGESESPLNSVAPGGKDGPRHAAATHPDSSRITKKLRRVEKMKLCTEIIKKLKYR